MLLIFKINVCFSIPSRQYLTTTISPSASIAEVLIRFLSTWEFYASIMDNFAVYMQDNTKFDFIMINGNTVSIDDALISIIFYCDQKKEIL